MIVEILLGVSIVLNIGLVLLVQRLSKRLLEFDDLFELLEDDVATNIAYFTKLLHTPLLNNSPEVISMQKNVEIIAKRLQEFALRMNETTNKDETPGE